MLRAVKSAHIAQLRQLVAPTHLLGYAYCLFSVICFVALSALAQAQAQQTPPQAQTAQKVLRTAFPAAETGFDPQKRDDRYSIGIIENMFEPLLTYDYLARPVKLVPLVAEAVPAATEGGTVYEFKIKPGILFADDPAFNGKKRELVAADFVYAIKRFRDPAIRSPYEWLFEGNIAGLDEFVDEAKKSNKFDYDKSVEGLQALTKYTLRIKLKQPDYNFLYLLALPHVAPMPREVVEKYKDNTDAHPVGTGPFILTKWLPKSRIVLERNPNFRGKTLETRYANLDDEWDKSVIEKIKGKTLPLLDRIEIFPIEEDQPRYLAFLNGEHDYLDETPFEYLNQVLKPDGSVHDKLAKRGVRAFRDPQMEIVYTAFNTETSDKNPHIGGFEPHKVALRRAMSLAYDVGEEARIVRRNSVVIAQSPIPPGIVGYDPDFINPEAKQNMSKAKALLDTYGYLDRDGDGWRETPEGKLMKINYKYQTGRATDKQVAELWVKHMTTLGVKIDTTASQFSDYLKDKKVGKLEFGSSAWIADYPDAQNFFQLLWGNTVGQNNDARFKHPKFDELYKKSIALPDGPERNALYREMNRVIIANAPWKSHVHRVYVHLIYPWTTGYKKHPILYTSFMYMDVDVEMRRKSGGESAESAK